jgi:phosphohistidine phosphatase
MRAFSMAIGPSAMPRHYHERMEIFVIRHAKAEERDPEAWPDDAERPLTRDGAREFERVARQLGRWRGSVDMLLSSGHVRAWDTARIVRAKAGWPKPVRTKLLEAEGAGAAAAAVAFLSEQPADARIALVGHEPMLGEVVASLCGGGGALRLEFRKGAVAWLRGEPGAMALAGLLVPGMVRR